MCQRPGECVEGLGRSQERKQGDWLEMCFPGRAASEEKAKERLLSGLREPVLGETSGTRTKGD